jgi:hypothetical protein
MNMLYYAQYHAMRPRKQKFSYKWLRAVAPYYSSKQITLRGIQYSQTPDLMHWTDAAMQQPFLIT